VTGGQSGVVADGQPNVEVPPNSARREVVRFATETVALLIGVAAAVLAAVPVSLVVAYVLTAGITGWRDPGPDIIQGCEKSLTCSESATFLPLWGLTFLAYVVVTVLVFRVVLNRLAPPLQRRG